MKKVVYTVHSGHYDQIKPVKFENDGVDFYIISDEEITPPKGWKVIVIENEKGNSPVMYNRKYKINPFLLFDEYDISLYLDSNIEVISELEELFYIFSNSDEKIACYEHPVRDCVYEEANEIKRIGYDYFFKVNKQMRKYKNEGYEKLFLREANVIFRKNDIDLKNAMIIWWDEFSNGVKRDQLSLSYSLKRANVSMKSLGLHDARFVNKYFLYHEHLKKNKSRNIKARVLNKLAKLMCID